MMIGDTIPKLTGLLHDGRKFAIEELRGKYVVVYFYPKDNTPGCTREAQDFRDLYTKFKQQVCEIIGVSRDTAAMHEKFRCKYDLPFPLLADTDEVWCKTFNVLGEKVLYGRRSIGIIRSTFLIDPKGMLCAQWRKVKVPGHAQAVLENLMEKP